MNDYVQATPFSGHLIHAVRNQPEFFYRPMPSIVTTYHRAICGVGHGGMRVQTEDDKTTLKPWDESAGCPACNRRLKQIKDKA